MSETIEAANKTHSTGPRTEEGKSISSQNACKTGLFAVRDFIRPEEREQYEVLSESLEAELNPEGPLETHLAAEIRTAIWRLRRCAQLESNLAAAQFGDEAIAKQQLSIDRARNQTTRLLHKNTAELRRIQTERVFRNEIAADGIPTENLGLCDFHTAISHADRAAKNAERHTYNQLKTKLETWDLESRCNDRERAAAAAETEFTKRTPPPAGHAATPVASSSQAVARNAPCPCQSGEKYKRCCGRQAPPILNTGKPITLKQAA